METSTALTVQERAAVALGAAAHEAKLIEMAKQSTEIVAITNPASYQQAHGARMALKTARVSIEKTGKAAREDATAFSKAIIAEEKRLIGIIEPEETRLQELQANHDAKAEAEKQAKIKAEEERMARVQAAIEDIRSRPLRLTGKPSAEVTAAIQSMENVVIGEWAFEFKAQAQAAKEDALATLRQLHIAALASEAEQERIKAERAELARLRAEQDERTRQEAARITEQAKAEAEARRKIEDEERAARARIEAEERQARAAREEADRKAREAQEAEAARLKSIQDKIDADRRALEDKQRKEREAAEAKARQERLVQEQKERELREKAEAEARAERLAREEREAAERSALREIEDADLMLTTFKELFGQHPRYSPIVKAIDAYFKKQRAEKNLREMLPLQA